MFLQQRTSKKIDKLFSDKCTYQIQTGRNRLEGRRGPPALTTAEAGTLWKALNPSLDKSQLCAVGCAAGPESAPRGWQQHDNPNTSCQLSLSATTTLSQDFPPHEHCSKGLNSSRLSFPATNGITRGKVYLSPAYH